MTAPGSVIESWRRLRALAEGLDHPEGVCWCPTRRCIYAGGEAGQLYRIDPDTGSVELVAQVPDGFLVGIAVDLAGDVYACDIGNGCVQRIRPDAGFDTYGAPIDYPNYPVFDAAGNLYVSDSGAWDEPTGGVVRISPGGSTDRLPLRPLNFANGLAILDDRLLIVESATAEVSTVDLTGGDVTTIVELGRTVPDGLAVDIEGGIWISCFQPNRISRLTLDGDLEIVVDDWAGSHLFTPTNIAFAGTSLDVLAVASLGGSTISTFDPGVKGRPLSYPLVRA